MSRIQELKRHLSIALQHSDWEEALGTLQNLIDLEDSQPAYHNQVGDIFLKMGQQIDAIDSFLRGIRSYREMGMYPNGAALCKKVMRLEPDHKEAIWILGELKTRQGFLSDGAEKMLDALRLYAEDPETEKQNLIDLLAQAEQLQGGSREVLEVVATTYAQVDERAQAKAVTLRIADIEEREGRPDNASYLRTLAQQYVADAPGGEAGPSGEPIPPATEPPAGETTPSAMEHRPDEGMSPAMVVPIADPMAAPPATATGEVGSVPLPPAHGEGGEEKRSAGPLTDYLGSETPVLKNVEQTRVLPTRRLLEQSETTPGQPSLPEDIDPLADTLPPVEDKPAHEPEADKDSPPVGKAANGESLDELVEETLAEMNRTLPEIEVLTPDRSQHPAPEQAEAEGAAPDDPAGQGDVEVLSPDTTVPGVHDSVEAAGDPMATDDSPVAGEASSEDDPPAEEKLQLQSFQDAIQVANGPQSEEAEGEGSAQKQEAKLVDAPPGLSLTTRLRAPEEPVAIGLSTTSGEALQGDDVEEVLQEFRSRLENQMGSMAPEERYQLGVSYMEMALYEEALAEFEHSLSHPDLGQKTCEWMARCLNELGRHADLVELLGAVLEEEPFPHMSSVELYYLLGIAYEALGKKDLALDSFTKVYQLDVDFRDVQGRLEKLTHPA